MMVKPFAMGVLAAAVMSAAHGQMLDDYSNDSLYSSPLRQILGQKRHAHPSRDPYMSLIEGSDPYYATRSTAANASHGALEQLATGVTLPVPGGGNVGAATAALGLVAGAGGISSMMNAGSALSITARAPGLHAAELGRSIANATIPGMTTSSVSPTCLLSPPTSAISLLSLASSCR